MRLVAHERKKENARDDWETPGYIIKWLEHHIGLPCTLDVCAEESTTKASNFYTKEDDALTKEWKTNGFAFCNPPYNQLEDFLCKAEGQSTAHYNYIAVLIPPRTDTWVWHEIVPSARDIIFIRGRVSFLQAGIEKKSNGAASCILIFKKSPNMPNEQTVYYINREEMKTCDKKGEV